MSIHDDENAYVSTSHVPVFIKQWCLMYLPRALLAKKKFGCRPGNCPAWPRCQRYSIQSYRHVGRRRLHRTQHKFDVGLYMLAGTRIFLSSTHPVSEQLYEQWLRSKGSLHRIQLPHLARPLRRMQRARRRRSGPRER